MQYFIFRLFSSSHVGDIFFRANDKRVDHPSVSDEFLQMEDLISGNYFDQVFFFVQTYLL